MTRKHFEALASALRASKPNPDSLEAMSAWIACVTNIACELRAFNSAFNKHRFYVACNYEYA